MPDPRLTIKLRSLQAQRDDLRRRLEHVDAEIRGLQELLAHEAAGATDDEVAQLAAEVEEYLGARIVARAGSQVNLRRCDDRGDLLCIVLAARLEQDGSWWADIGRLTTYLASVKGELVKQGHL